MSLLRIGSAAGVALALLTSSARAQQDPQDLGIGQTAQDPQTGGTQSRPDHSGTRFGGQGYQRAGLGSGVGLGGAALGPGVAVGERALLHAGVLTESGYDSNVFYEDADQTPREAGVLRVTPSLLLTNAERDGSVPSVLLYSLGAALMYREYLFTDDRNVREQRAFNPAASLLLSVSPGQSFGFSVADTFVRLQEPPYLESTGHITRINNTGYVQLRFTPGGGRFQSLIRYTNTIDRFEEPFQVGSSMLHNGTLDLSWRWLPKTAIFIQGNQGYIDYWYSDKPSGYPLRVFGGIRGLITAKLSANLAAGYSTGFFERGPNPSGFAAGASVSYRPLLSTGITLGYEHDFRQSPFVGSYYYMDGGVISMRQAIATRLVLSAEGRYEYRRYRGESAMLELADRKDHFYAAGAAADFAIREWIFLGVGYALSANDSTTNVSSVAGPDYVKHQVFGRLSLNY